MTIPEAVLQKIVLADILDDAILSGAVTRAHASSSTSTPLRCSRMAAVPTTSGSCAGPGSARRRSIPFGTMNGDGSGMPVRAASFRSTSDVKWIAEACAKPFEMLFVHQLAASQGHHLRGHHGGEVRWRRFECRSARDCPKRAICLCGIVVVLAEAEQASRYLSVVLPEHRRPAAKRARSAKEDC